MRTANIGLNSLIIVICGLFYWQTFNYTTTFGQDGIGPAFFPRIILIIIMITSLIELIRSFSLEKSSLIPKEKRGHALRMVLFIVVIALYISVLGTVNFILASSVALFFLSMMMKLRLLPSLITSVALSVVVYLIFSSGFNIIL